MTPGRGGDRAPACRLGCVSLPGQGGARGTNMTGGRRTGGSPVETMDTHGLTPRTGASIREFLRCHVLALARWRRRTVAGIISEIKRKSACNRQIRRSGQLLIDGEELAQVLGHLERQRLIASSGKAWRLTRKGRRKLALYDQQRERGQDTKDRAARILLEWMGPRRAGKVLDVGTGDGYLAWGYALDWRSALILCAGPAAPGGAHHT